MSKFSSVFGGGGGGTGGGPENVNCTGRAPKTQTRLPTLLGCEKKTQKMYHFSCSFFFFAHPVLEELELLLRSKRRTTTVYYPGFRLSIFLKGPQMLASEFRQLNKVCFGLHLVPWWVEYSVYFDDKKIFDCPVPEGGGSQSVSTSLDSRHLLPHQ